MGTFDTITLILLGITGVILGNKNATRLMGVYLFLVLAFVGVLIIDGFDKSAHSAIYGLIAVAGINLVASQLNVLKKKFIRVLMPLATVTAYLLIMQDETITYLDKEYISVNKFFTIGMLLAVLAYELAAFKEKIGKKWLGDLSSEDFITSVVVLFSGVALFLGDLASSVFGLFAVATAFSASAFYRLDNTVTISTSLLTLAVLPMLLFVAGETGAQLIDGDVLQGVFVGGFGAFILGRYSKSKSPKLLISLLIYSLIIGVALGILWTGSVFFKMGGMDAYIGVLVGAAIVGAVTGSFYSSTALFVLLLTGGLILPKFMVNEEELAFEEQTLIITNSTNVNDEGDATPVIQGLPLDDIQGKHTFVSDSSTVTFALGEGGETKGAFKTVTGDVTISKDIESSSLNVLLPMKNFTTFQSMRDNSLRGDDYFKVDKYPTMSYKVNGFKLVAQNEYELEGKFTMLGVTKTIKVNLMRVENNGKSYLIGGGTIDRTLFGMTPDASEGNIVDFNYQVLLD